MHPDRETAPRVAPLTERMLRRDPMRDILALDGGTLSERRRARALARVAADPEAQRMLDQQRRVRAALEALPVYAPSSLRARIERLHADAERTLLPIALTRRATVAAAVACAALALVFTLMLSSQAPTTTAVAAVVHRQAAEPAPQQGSRPALLDREFAGVEFPRWRDEFGWNAVGARRDTIDGRATDTVFYFHQGHRVSYTVVGGAPLEPPSDARRVRIGATTGYVYHDDEDHTVVTFERNGRTCVLAGHVIRDSTLIELADWRGGGTVEF
jgi:hypothetical protein